MGGWQDGDNTAVSARLRSLESQIAELTSGGGDSAVTGVVGLNPKLFGAVGNGTHDDTAAIEEAAAFSDFIQFPAGTFVYNGSGLSNLSLRVEGSIRGDTVIQLGSGTTFYKQSAQFTSGAGLLFRNIEFNGGVGVVAHTYTGSNVNPRMSFENCNFFNYSGTALYTLSNNFPYWKFINCQWFAANTTQSIGFAHAGQSQQTLFLGCSFLLNRVHLKFNQPDEVQIRSCDFLQFVGTAANPRIFIWLVPFATDTSGMTIDGATHFGTEALLTTDYRIVIADEDTTTGTDHSNYLPDMTTQSTNSLHHVRVAEDTKAICNIANGPPLIFSTTWLLQGCHVACDVGGAFAPPYLVQYLNPIGAQTAQPFLGGNVWGPLYLDFITQTGFIAPTNSPNSSLADPNGSFEMVGRQTTHAVQGGVEATSYVNLTSARVTGWGTSNATKTTITDSRGGTDAVEVTFNSLIPPGLIDSLVPSSGAALIPGEPIWFEFDMKQGSTSPATSIEVAFGPQGTSTDGSLIQQLITPPATWTRYRFVTYGRTIDNVSGAHQRGSAFLVPNTQAIGCTVQIGRVRVYHAREPVMADLDIPNALVAGSWTSAAAVDVVEVNINGTAYNIALYSPGDGP